MAVLPDVCVKLHPPGRGVGEWSTVQAQKMINISSQIRREVCLLKGFIFTM